MKKNPPSIRLFRRPSNPFPRVKTPAAYVCVRCYTPARVSNFVKDFLAGAYHQTSKESKHVFGFVGGARLWEGCSMFSYVLRQTVKDIKILILELKIIFPKK